MKVFVAICLLAAAATLCARADTVEGETGAVVLYTAVAAATPDRQSIAAVSMTAQAYQNEASCRNAQEWFKRLVTNAPTYGITTNSWCAVKVPF